jgi:hypothetical protein
MPEPLRILAGDCTVTYEDGDETRRERGNTISIIKPDNCGELLVDRFPGVASGVASGIHRTVRKYPNDYTRRSPIVG